jgi:putative membrane protein
MESRASSRTADLAPPVPFRQNRFLHAVILVYLAFWVATAINPYYRFGWWLENILVFLSVGLAVATYRRFPFSNLSYLCFMLFLALHTLGAYYSYTTTPIDVLLHKLFSFERDMFDRVVHMGFGLLMAYPVWEWLVRAVRIEQRWAYFMTIVAVLAAAGFYELIEMWVAKIVDPESGTLFLGTQGDVWDAQQDIAVALYGSLAAVAVTIFGHSLARRRQPDGPVPDPGGWQQDRAKLAAARRERVR